MPTNGPGPFSRQLDVEVRRLHGHVRAGWADVARDADLRTPADWRLVGPVRRAGGRD